MSFCGIGCFRKECLDAKNIYRYDAALEDPYRRKRKVIRGGSWKDIAHNVRADLRAWEYQNEQRSFIGFRCVRTQIGFAKGKMKVKK